jgi:hypothetical protein
MDRTQRRHRRRPLQRPVGMTCGLVLAVLAATGATSQAARAAAPPGITETVLGLAVSPAFSSTGTVVAAAAPPTQCPPGQQCMHLWVSHDGGASWSRAAARGWVPGTLSIATDGQGHDVMFTGASSGLLRSDDGGATWTSVGDAGTPTAAPSFPVDKTLAVAGSSDYVLTDGHRSGVRGSGGALSDYSFMYAPSFPSAGRNAPALLVGTDQKTGVPIVEQCDASLACHGGTTPPGAASYPPFNLVPSSTYASDGTVFLQTGRGIYKSIDGGATFQPLTPASTKNASATATPGLALATGYRESGPNRTVYAGLLQASINQIDPAASTTTGGVYRSIDGGATWKNISAGTALDKGATAMAVSATGRIFAGYTASGRSGLLCSDGGSWQATCSAVGQHSGSSAAGGTGAGPGTGTSGSSGCTGSDCTGTANGANNSQPGSRSTAGAALGNGDSQSAPNAVDVKAQASVGGATWWPIAVAGSVGLVALGAALPVAARRRRNAAAPEDE